MTSDEEKGDPEVEAAARRGSAGDAATTIPATDRARRGHALPERPRPEDEGKERIGRFVIEGTLGRGGMARVLLARDTRIERQVALKLLDLGPDGTAIASSDQRIRFLNEARAIGRLSHPNIVEIYDTAEDETTGRAWIAMELVRGSDLLGLIREGVSPKRLLEIAQQVAAALSHAHERGIVHRDLKPGNVLIDHEGRVRLGDWGIARLEGVELTEPGSTIGSPPYMAPEQGLGAQATPQTDVHALALLIHEGLTGKRLRRKPTEPAQPDIEALMSGPAALSRGKAEAVARVLSLSLALEPASRHESPEALVDAVRKALEPAWTETPLAATATAVATPAWRGGPRWGFVALGLVGLVLLGALVPRSSSPPDEPPASEDVAAPTPASKPPAEERERRDPVEPPRPVIATPSAPESSRAADVVIVPQERPLRILLRSRVPGVLVVESGTRELARMQLGEEMDDALTSDAEPALPAMAEVRGHWHATRLQLPREDVAVRFLFLRPRKGEVALLQQATFDLEEGSEAWAVLQVQGLLGRQLSFAGGLGPHPSGSGNDKDVLDAWAAARRHWSGDSSEPGAEGP